MALATQQVTQLLKGINPARVSKDNKGRAHVEAYEIRAHLNRIFGFGAWDQETLVMEPIFETVEERADKGVRVDCAYRAQVRLRIHATSATYTEWATGDAANFPLASRADAHDFAVKTAESQALKRCAVNLGDQFGLSLYNRGTTKPLVLGIVVGDPTKNGGQDGASVDAHITEPLSPEASANTGVPAGTEAPAPSEPAKEQEPPAPPYDVDDLRSRVLAAKKQTELGDLLGEAIRHGVDSAVIGDAAGEQVTVKALIQRQLHALRPRKATVPTP